MEPRAFFNGRKGASLRVVGEEDIVQVSTQVALKRRTALGSPTKDALRKT